MITPSQLPPKYQQHQLIPTIDGVTSSVYMLDDIFVLKLFDKETPLKQIESEIKFLKSFDNLAVAKVVDRFDINEYQVIIYTQIKGKIITNPTIKHIEEIGIFLRNFHKQSRNILTLKQEFFSKKELKRAINLTSNPILLKYFDRIKIELKSDGIIHGDLFPDNCKFQDYKLSGVYDFSDACIGDFNFELGVVASSWCFDKNILNEKKLKHF